MEGTAGQGRAHREIIGCRIVQDQIDVRDIVFSPTSAMIVALIPELGSHEEDTDILGVGVTEGIEMHLDISERPIGEPTDLDRRRVRVRRASFRIASFEIRGVRNRNDNVTGKDLGHRSADRRGRWHRGRR